MKATKKVLNIVKSDLKKIDIGERKKGPDCACPGGRIVVDVFLPVFPHLQIP